MHQPLYAETYIKDETSSWLVFLHGFGGSSKMWKKQLDSFREHYNLLLLDLPGHGKSRTGISELGVRTFEDVADLVVHTMEVHGVEQAGFVCCSLGTLVFAAIQDKYPQIVTSAILCGAVSGVSRKLQAMLAMLDRTKEVFPYRFVLRSFARLLLPLKEHETARNFFIESSKLLDRMEFLAWFSLVVREQNKLRNLHVSMKHVLFISGTEDFTFLRGVKKTFGAMSDANLALLKHCGHVCNLQLPKEFNALSLSFLNQTIPALV